MIRRILVGAFVVLAVQNAHSYDRSVAHQYIERWCRSDGNRNGNVDHVNNPNAVVDPGPPGSNYMWWYKIRPIPFGPLKQYSLTWNDYGSDWIPVRIGFDCTNFVSQVLSTGGVTLSGLDSQQDDPIRGTFIRVDRLYEALVASPNAVAVNINGPDDNPTTLDVGDPVRFPTLSHMAVVVATNPIRLAYHTPDYCAPLYRPISTLAEAYFPLIGFHIIGNTISAPADTTSPAMQIRHADGASIPDGGFTGSTAVTAVLSDSGDGVQKLEAFEGAPAIDGATNLLYGFAANIFRDNTFRGGSSTYTVNLSRLAEGNSVYFQGFDAAGNAAIQSVGIDRVPPTASLSDSNGAPFVYVSSMSQVTVLGFDTFSGIDRITLLKPDNTTLTQTFFGELIAYATFTTLTDNGSYLATVFDRAHNTVQTAFIISTSDPFAEGQDDKNAIIGDAIPSSRCIVIHATDTVAGIASISISGTGLSRTMSYQCGVPAKSTDVYAGAFCNLAEHSTYTFITTSCSGKQKTSDEITVTTSTKGGRICVTAPAGTFCGGVGALSDTQLLTWGPRLRVCMSAISCGYCNIGGFDNIVTSPAGSPYCGDTCCRVISWTAPLADKSFSVANTAESDSTDDGYYRFSIYNPANGDEGEASRATLNSPNFKMGQGQSTSGTIEVAQIGQGSPTVSPDGIARVDSPFARLQLSLRSLSEHLLQLGRQLMRASSPIYGYSGSDAVFNSTTTFTLAYDDTVNTDTTTARIYMFDGVSWSSSGITNQSISYSTTTHIITASGSIDRTGLYATLYQAQDSSSPVTTFAIQGSSFNFDGALFVSTDAYVVLTATDPVVDGFASTVASVTYRIDPSPGSPFSIYASSVPLPLGTHVFEYRSLDYAGNAEAVKTATFTVTAGTAFRTPGTAQVPGVLLNGFLGSGAKLEVESQAQNSLTLLISSVNRQGMVFVDNIGQVGIGVTPQANLNLGQSAIALQLRSGNSTSAVTSNQLAFGFNGDSSMRHLLRTEHSTSTDGNKMDFLVWNTGAGSTAAVAGLNVLSLQGIASAGGGSFHVQPAGEPDAEVEVSNGLSPGAGTMQCADVVSPSSRRFKTDIKDLREKDEDRALADVAELKHATFRYRTLGKDGLMVEDTAQPLRTGLIYEESPESVRDGAGALSATERLVNVELALKASIRRLEALQKRYEALKARRRNP